MSNHKIALISDIHFGVKGNSETYLKIIQDFFLKTLKEVIEVRDIKDVRILGDLFDCRNHINVRTINVVLEIFDWYEKNMPDVAFKILLGNHDIYFKNRVDVNSVSMLAKFNNVEIISEITEETINGKSVITYPWIVDESTTESLFKSHCSGKKKWDLCLGHFEIRGFEMTRGNPDIAGVEQGQFKNYGRVFTGHYHLRNTNNQISYLGCPYELTWNDYQDEKGIHIYNVDSGETEFIPNNDSPKHIRLSADKILEADAKTLKSLAHNTIKIIIDKKYSEDELNMVYNKLSSVDIINLDTENNYIDEDVEAEDVDISNLSNALVFLNEYVMDLTLEEEIVAEEALKYLKEIHSIVEER